MQITHNFREFATACRFVMMADSTTTRTAWNPMWFVFDSFPFCFWHVFSQARAVIKPVCFVAVQFKLASKALRWISLNSIEYLPPSNLLQNLSAVFTGCTIWSKLLNAVLLVSIHVDKAGSFLIGFRGWLDNYFFTFTLEIDKVQFVAYTRTRKLNHSVCTSEEC